MALAVVSDAPVMSAALFSVLTVSDALSETLVYTVSVRILSQSHATNI